jgi:integrase
MKGTIRVRPTKDGKQRYTCQVFAGVDPRTGKKRYLTGTATSERQAHQVLHRLINQVEAGLVSRERATLEELIDAWLEVAGPPGEQTRLVYRQYIKKHIAPTIGTVAVSKIRVEDLDRFYASLSKYGLGPASVRKVHNIIRGAMTQGVKWGWIPNNIAASARPPKVPKAVVMTPTPSSVANVVRMAADLDPEVATYIRLAAVTGARPGEMCGLRWNDLRGDELAIERRVIKAEGGPMVKDLTKTDKTRRIPLDARTVEFLQAHRQRLEERAAAFGVVLDRDAYIFSDTPDGSAPWRPDSTSRRFRTARDKAGLDGVTLYSIRHQTATALIDSGVDPKTVSDRLGNSVATVLGTYTRARSAADRSAADLIGGLLDE